MQSYILTKKFIDNILQIARGRLKRDGFLQSTLFLNVVNDSIAVVSLKLPDDAQKRALYFAGIGDDLRRKECVPSEAVLVSETWYVNARTAPGALRMLPHEHPSHQEAIVLAGRNAGNTRTSHVIQPYTRDSENHPIWQEIPIAVYDESPSSGRSVVGLLDYFFEAMVDKA